MSLFDYDSIEALGRVGKEPEMKYLPDGRAVTSFSVAVDRSYKPKGGELVKRTIWYRVSVFGPFAEVCAERIHKGGRVFFVGELTPDISTGGPRVWESNGKHGAAFEVTAATVRFLSSDKQEQGQPSEEETDYF